MPFTPWEIALLVSIGFIAGTSGGLVGLGGSIIMIPALTIIMGEDQHLAQASAMTVNVFIAAPSVVQHSKAGTVPKRVLLLMLPIALVFIMVGVEASNHMDGAILKKIFGVFLLYVMLMKLSRLYLGRKPHAEVPERVSPLASGTVGGVMGFFAGLLGIGGGPIAVPLFQKLCRLPLREAIAASAAAMCVTSVVGATFKNLALGRAVGVEAGAGNGTELIFTSLMIATCIAPTAILGAMIGASLTHRIPLFWVRIVFIVLVGGASLMMLGVFG